ncbi:uncharacterized protein LOC122061198 [Macadamia integrifolia]|uniref:uncharacterized protein LOC122061198 n=1 Tax=Macadamia integrifolia TaxID=60698 RepID=UPI001C52CDD1|nr:uncharacterized protein LOC122061198 [Macadamia integrifolia]
MEVFQSPVEALAFNYVSFGFLATVQSFLTCIAIVTAAISFWRIRAVGSNSFHGTKSPSSGDSNSPPSFDGRCRSTVNLSSPPMQVVSTWSAPESEKEKKEKPFHQEKICSSFGGVGAIKYDDDKEGNGHCRVIKDKFTLYYQGEEDTIPIAGVGVDVVCSYREEIYYSDERWSCDVIRMRRRSDLGWYHSQDLTVFNGSVVRLWDCHRRRCLSPSNNYFLAL